MTDQEQHEELKQAIQTLGERMSRNMYSLEKKQDDMSAILTPMNESYQAAIRIGKWTSGLLVFISIAIGIVLSLKDLFKKQ